MQVGRYWVITSGGSTGDGPWHVGYPSPRPDNSWYIVNEQTEEARKIGPVTMSGHNYFDEAVNEARRLNGRRNKN